MKQEEFEELMQLLDQLEDLAHEAQLDPSVIDHILFIRYTILQKIQ